MPGPSVKTIRRLFAVSGNQCAFPGCTNPLVDEATGTVTGELCHINGRTPGAPRYDPKQTDTQRHAFDNLILLCGPHHKVVDADPGTWSVEVLRRVKAARMEASQSGPQPTEDMTFRFVRRWSKDERIELGIWIFTILFVLFLFWAFLFGPPDLPQYKQRIIALTGALLAGLLGFFITGAIIVKFKAPLHWPQKAKLGAQAAGGAAFFLLVLVWWWSDFAPIAVSEATIHVPQSGDQRPHSEPRTTPKDIDIASALIEGRAEEKHRWLVPTIRFLKQEGDSEIKLGKWHDSAPIVVATVPFSHPTRSVTLQIIPAPDHDVTGDVFRVCSSGGAPSYQPLSTSRHEGERGTILAAKLPDCEKGDSLLLVLRLSSATKQIPGDESALRRLISLEPKGE